MQQATMARRAWIAAGLVFATVLIGFAPSADAGPNPNREYFIGSEKGEYALSFAARTGGVGKIWMSVPHMKCETEDGEPAGEVSLTSGPGPARLDNDGKFDFFEWLSSHTLNGPRAYREISGELHGDHAEGKMRHTARPHTRPHAARRYCDTGRIDWQAEQVAFSQWRKFRKSEQGISPTPHDRWALKLR